MPANHSVKPAMPDVSHKSKCFGTASVRRTCGFAVCTVILAYACGCSWLGHNQVEARSSLSAQDVLQRCVAAHEALDTFHARGTLRDYRTEDRRVAMVAWDFSRPDRCRLQIGMHVSIISGDRWWNYDPVAGRYRTHSQFTKTPIETAALLLSKGVPFLLPSLFTRGDEVFGRLGSAERSKWIVKGVGWYAGQPCYVVEKEDYGKTRSHLMRVWVDQDLMLIRGWTIGVQDRRGQMKTVLGCRYEVLQSDPPLSADCFQLKPPLPITLPRTGASTGSSL